MNRAVVEAEAVSRHPVLICLFGVFRVVKAGSEIPIRSGGKTAMLLTSLAMRDRYRASREWLVEALWPDGEAARSLHALNSLIHTMRPLLGDALGGAPPVMYASGGYQLNVDAGVRVDIGQFDGLASLADRQLRSGDTAAAMSSWQAAVALYLGDVCVVDDVRAVIERERLRALHLSLLASMADRSFLDGQYRSALRYALRLLLHDPCREDAHRVVMRCHVRLGERAQALRQYRTCQQILQTEFHARPEPLTDALFERVRLRPEDV